jgi:hypothetical protein
VTTEYPLFIPAKSRVRLSLNIPYTYPVQEKSYDSPEERRQYKAGVARYVADTFSNLDGFVLFDTTTRYEIDFPTGWEQSAKEGVTHK